MKSILFGLLQNARNFGRAKWFCKMTWLNWFSCVSPGGHLNGLCGYLLWFKRSDATYVCVHVHLSMGGSAASRHWAWSFDLYPKGLDWQVYHDITYLVAMAGGGDRGMLGVLPGQAPFYARGVWAPWITCFTCFRDWFMLLVLFSNVLK